MHLYTCAAMKRLGARRRKRPRPTAASAPSRSRARAIRTSWTSWRRRWTKRRQLTSFLPQMSGNQHPGPGPEKTSICSDCHFGDWHREDRPPRTEGLGPEPRFRFHSPLPSGQDWLGGRALQDKARWLAGEGPAGIFAVTTCGKGNNREQQAIVPPHNKNKTTNHKKQQINKLRPVTRLLDDVVPPPRQGPASGKGKASFGYPYGKR